jgi:hypothetical protein
VGFAIAGILPIGALLGDESEESEESDISKEIEEETLGVDTIFPYRS